MLRPTKANRLTKHLLFVKRETRPVFMMERKAGDVTGAMSTFGGPGDSGVSPSEGLALMAKADLTDPKFAYLFELEQPVATTGLARRLDAKQAYLAMRWQYSQTSKSWLRSHKIKLTANGITIQAQPVDYGPAEWTGRVADISPGAAKALKLKTNDVVTVTFPLS